MSNYYTKEEADARFLKEINIYVSETSLLTTTLTSHGKLKLIRVGTTVYMTVYGIKSANTVIAANSTIGSIPNGYRPTAATGNIAGRIGNVANNVSVGAAGSDLKLVTATTTTNAPIYAGISFSSSWETNDAVPSN